MAEPAIVLEMKLHPPPLRPGLISRAGLLGTAHSHVNICAPAGYGKTTLLAQYALAAERPTAWVSLDESDDDPILLLRELATSLAQVAPVHPAVFRSLSGANPSVARVVLPGLVNALGSAPGVALILDDLHLVENERSITVVGYLCDHVPPGARLLVASRRVSRLPLAHPRARGDLLEVGASDLALTGPEVDRLLQAAGVALDGGALEAVVDRAEGWPAVITLAALTLGAADEDDVPRPADDRSVVDFLSEQLLSQQPERRLSFLLRASVLERLSASLCDAVLERNDSAAMIAEVEEANLFLLPLDRARRWYRFHHLFRDVLRGELARRDPDSVEPLHRRAAEWHMRHGRPEEAVRHALAGRDVNRAAEIVVRNSGNLLDTGRHATARSWVDAFSDDDMAASASLALSSALTVGLLGELQRARRYVVVAERAPWTGLGAMGESSRESALALITALFGWEGARRMRTQAAVAYRTEPVGSPAHEAAALAMGCASELLGCTTEAAVYLEEAAALGRERAGVTLLAQGQIARILLEAGSTDDAQRRALDGLELAVDLHLDEQTVSILLHAIAAALLAARDDATGARGHLDRALRLLPRTAAFPWLEIETRIVLARAGRTIGDRALSGLLLQEARRTLTRFGDPGVLPGLLAREERALERTLGGAGAIREPLTGAERRVLELLPTHLSLEAVGAVLHISRNTVKAHLKSIYRKLGVGRRSEAVEAARLLGLLDDRP